MSPTVITTFAVVFAFVLTAYVWLEYRERGPVSTYTLLMDAPKLAGRSIAARRRFILGTLVAAKVIPAALWGVAWAVAAAMVLA